MDDEVLAQHKLLKVNGETTPTGTPNPLAIPVVTGIPNGNGADPSAVAIANAHIDTIKTLGEVTPA